ncbi:MAG: transposase [Saprospiraceae bacterium]|nr:transposase [Saprospiraceae bacterium]MCW5923474.1 transposase [Saprospiraceae bacterium]
MPRWRHWESENAALTANAGIYKALEPIEEQIKTAVLASDVVHFDETGMRVRANASKYNRPRRGQMLVEMVCFCDNYHDLGEVECLSQQRGLQHSTPLGSYTPRKWGVSTNV